MDAPASCPEAERRCLVTRSLLVFGVGILIALYVMIDRYAGNDGEAAATLTVAAGFLAVQTVCLLMER